MSQELKDKLAAALAVAANAKATYEPLCLAFEEGSATAAQVATAAKQLQAADDRVRALQTAAAEAENREAARIADAEAEAERVQKAALDASLVALNAIGVEWQATADRLKEIAGRYLDATTSVRGFHPSAPTNRQIESARSIVSQVESLSWCYSAVCS